MNAKEKAEELVDKYSIVSNRLTYISHKGAKICATIAVNEILNIKSVDKDYDLSNYWQQVKQEIEKL
jgi:hypothetical protein